MLSGGTQRHCDHDDRTRSPAGARGRRGQECRPRTRPGRLAPRSSPGASAVPDRAGPCGTRPGVPGTCGGDALGCVRSTASLPTERTSEAQVRRASNPASCAAPAGGPPGTREAFSRPGGLTPAPGGRSSWRVNPGTEQARQLQKRPEPGDGGFAVPRPGLAAAPGQVPAWLGSWLLLLRLPRALVLGPTFGL